MLHLCYRDCSITIIRCMCSWGERDESRTKQGSSRESGDRTPPEENMAIISHNLTPYIRNWGIPPVHRTRCVFFWQMAEGVGAWVSVRAFDRLLGCVRGFEESMCPRCSYRVCPCAAKTADARPYRQRFLTGLPPVPRADR